MTKMTKREMFVAIGAFLSLAPANMDATPEGINPEDFLEDAVAFVNHEIELLDRKRSGSKGMTKDQIVNQGIKMEIVRVLNSVDEATATDIAKELDISVQKATSLLTQLVKDTKSVERVTDGKKVRFRTIG